MSNFATLYSLGHEHDILYFVTPDQYKIMSPFFSSKNFSENVSLINKFDPYWMLRVWINPFP